MQIPIKIALQKSGRLTEESLSLLKSCDISFEKNSGYNQLKTTARNFPLEILFVRDEDILNFVADGVADLGIVGENIINEFNKPVEVIQKLGFSNCRLSIAVPKNSGINSAAELNGKRIATTYPNILSGYLKENRIECEIHVVKGSVEISPSIGVAEAICDLVGTGSTLLINGLKELEVVLRSEAALIKSPSVSSESVKLIEDLVFRINSVQRARNTRYMLLNAPTRSLDEILALLPSLKSPTILPLADPEWVSIHSVIDTDKFWEIVSKLKAAGAEGILVSSLEKIIP